MHAPGPPPCSLEINWPPQESARPARGGSSLEREARASIGLDRVKAPARAHAVDCRGLDDRRLASSWMARAIDRGLTLRPGLRSNACMLARPVAVSIKGPSKGLDESIVLDRRVLNWLHSMMARAGQGGPIPEAPACRRIRRSRALCNESEFDTRSRRAVHVVGRSIEQGREQAPRAPRVS